MAIPAPGGARLNARMWGALAVLGGAILGLSVEALAGVLAGAETGRWLSGPALGALLGVSVWFLAGRRMRTTIDSLAALEHTTCGAIVWDNTMNVVHLNGAALDILAIGGVEDLAGETGWRLVGQEDPDSLLRHVSGLFVRVRGRARCTFRVERPDLPELWIEGEVVPVEDRAGGLQHLIFTFVDVSHHKAAQNVAETETVRDSLTGLPNRVLLLDRLRQSILAARRVDGQIGLAVLDVHRLREVNDALGHQAGDELLKRIAERLSESIRDSDTVARLNGGEYALLLPGAGNTQTANLVMQKILQVFETPIDIEGRLVEVDSSIGLALFPDHATEPAELLRRAEIAMHAAKREGTEYVFFGEEFDTYSAATLTLRVELRQAIEAGAMALYYQPKVSLKGKGGLHAEALIRWPHPTRGIVPPDEFIPLAEQSGLIRPMTTWVINTALRQCRTWHDMGLDIGVAVNLSMRNVQDRSLPSIIEAALREWQADPSWLTAEITESMLMANPAVAMETLSAINDMGIALSIDDFGTGFSSLAYLQRLPLQELKIDKSFVHDLTSNQNDEAIVRSTIDLGHHLRLSVVAEGVEDEASLRRLDDLGCDIVQGYFLGKPMPATDFETWVRGSRWMASGGATVSAGA